MVACCWNGSLGIPCSCHCARMVRTLGLQMTGAGWLRNTHVFFLGVKCSTESEYCMARQVSFSACQDTGPNVKKKKKDNT